MTDTREHLLIQIVREGPRKYRWAFFRDDGTDSKRAEFNGSAVSRRQGKRKARRVIRRYLNARFPVRVEVIEHEEAL
jgi:hypothetical protein